MCIVNKICLLHIGKTGGSFLKSVLLHNKQYMPGTLEIVGHAATLQKTVARFGTTRKLAFCIRDPADRFVSAFYSRQRQGRPTYNSNWSTDEATAFLWFETAEDLALALDSPSERQKSAARFAMGAIRHLAQGYEFYLGSPVEFQRERSNIVMCVDLSRLDDRLPDVLTRLGLSEFEMPPEPRYHRAPYPYPELSSKAKTALRTYWTREFKLYDIALSFEDQIFNTAAS